MLVPVLTTPYCNPPYGLVSWPVPLLLGWLTQFKLTSKMKNFAVQSGVWSKKGNFTGKNAVGKTVFVSASNMSTLGFKEGDAIKPFYAIADDVQIGQFELTVTGLPVMGEDGKPKILRDKETGEPITTNRFEALSVYATKQALLSAQADDASLDAEVDAVRRDAIASVGATKVRAEFEQLV